MVFYYDKIFCNTIFWGGVIFVLNIFYTFDFVVSYCVNKL